MQHDLFPRSSLTLKPENGRNEPHLWVRRLVIWEKPSQIIRDIALKPGLNIIWSPDSNQQKDAPIGHGSGKTTFCRLLRYCLGEDSFAPDGQRTAIWNNFPEGHVGAEILLDGRLWIILRALGSKRRDIAIENASFADAFSENREITGITPFRDAVISTILGDSALLMPNAIGVNGAWEAALAWLTRDQECRFGHHLDWRDSNTSSNSSIRGRSFEDRLTVVRSFIGALTKEEILTRIEEGELDRFLSGNRSEFGRLDWQISRYREKLNQFFSGGVASGTNLDAAAMKDSANTILAKSLNLTTSGNITDLELARQNRDVAHSELRGYEDSLNQNAIRIEEKGKVVKAIESELPEAYAKSVSEQNPVCPICKVLIDKALAEGCGISTATCNLPALQESIEKRRAEMQVQINEITALKALEPTLKQNIALVRQRLVPLEKTVAALENAILQRSDAIRKAERLVDDVVRYEEFLTEKDKLESSIETAETQLEKIRETLAAHRTAVSDVVGELSWRFDTILRELIHANIQGEIKLDGKGLNLKVELGGERSTAAIDSLKVVAFDFSVLTLTMEGKTHLPAFLLHDSPREADLGASIYGHLFEVAKRLENTGASPLFQYIVTTTTEPPEDCRAEPWLRLTIHGSPAAERLLKTDL